MPRTHVHIERVRFGDLDAMRHLNNVVFLRYFETARIAFMRKLVPEHDPSSPERGGGGSASSSPSATSSTARR
jgi:acyl-CoA thioester hydrolase